jgi:dihydrofolate synthase / folylpolyglutamate synthase
VRPPDDRWAHLSSRGDEPGSLGDALAWLDRHINLERIESGQAGRAGLPTLDRIQLLCALMGDPQEHIPAIQVTGTNGKGSVTWMCANLIEANGLAVGTYTSPDLERINERIQFNREQIPDDALTQVLNSLEELEAFIVGRDPDALRPNWFEIVTAAAFRYFADVAVDAAVVEVGLGGRWDATNVANGTVAAVTNVELDHVEILGATRAAIAAEKSGIIKAGAIAVIGETDEEIVEIFEREAHTVGAEALWRRGEVFATERNELAFGGRLVDLRTPGAYYEEIFIPLFGAHQGENAAVALAAAEAFFGGPLERDVVEEGFAAVKVPGRLEVVGREPLVVIDGAHNPAGAETLAAAIREDFVATERCLLVLGCLRSRDPAEMLEALSPIDPARIFCCRPPSPRSMDPKYLADAAKEAGYAVEIIEDVPDALAAAHAAAHPRDLVLVTGSMYTIGIARSAARRLGSLGL